MALHCNNTGTDYMAIPINANTDPKTEFTLEFWVYLDYAAQQNTNLGLFEKQVTGGGHTFSPYVNTSNDIVCRVDTSTTTQAVGSTTIPALRTWQQYSFVYDGASTTAYIYQKGVQIGILNSAGSSLDPASATNIALGYWSDTGGALAYYSDCRLWNVARTQAQISANYNKRLVGNESGLQAYYKLISDVNDSTANGYNGTLHGTAAISSAVGEPPFFVPAGIININQAIARASRW